MKARTEDDRGPGITTPGPSMECKVLETMLSCMCVVLASDFANESDATMICDDVMCVCCNF